MFLGEFCLIQFESLKTKGVPVGQIKTVLFRLIPLTDFDIIL